MTRSMPLFAAVAALIALVGCAQLPPSRSRAAEPALRSDAVILSFEMPGLLQDTLAIDTHSRTISATVEPMDLTAATPSVTVSEGATLSRRVPLSDGTPAIFVVTAENGTEVEWRVTVTVQYGISFVNEGVRTVLAANDSSLFDGIPACVVMDATGTRFGTRALVFVASQEAYDFDAAAESGYLIGPNIYIEAGFDGEEISAPRTFDPATALVVFGDYPYMGGDPTWWSVPGTDEGTSVRLEISALGDVGGDVIGSFSAQAASGVGSLTGVTDGYLKVRRVAPPG